MINEEFREYGGFLPLELNPGKEWFASYDDSIFRFNSCKSAIACLLKNLHKKTVWLPYYYCPSTTKAILSLGYNVEFYHIDQTFSPCRFSDDKDSCIVLVNFWGINEKAITVCLEKIKYADVIIDNAHAFFSKPVLSNRIHNIYSAKKFFGVPDGAYLISLTDIIELETELSNSYEYAAFLVKSYEVGTNAAYDAKKVSDGVIANNYGNMSKLAKGLLENVDYVRVYKQRLKNFKYLREKFNDVNGIQIEADYSAYLFPLLLDGNGGVIKDKLISRKIYVPTLWRNDIDGRVYNDFEESLSKNVLFLPIDQRYNLKDMCFIFNIIESFL